MEVQLSGPSLALTRLEALGQEVFAKFALLILELVFQYIVGVDHVDVHGILHQCLDQDAIGVC